MSIILSFSKFRQCTRAPLRVLAQHPMRSVMLGAAVVFVLVGGHVARAADATSHGSGGGGKEEYIYLGDNGVSTDTTDDAIKQVNLATRKVTVFSKPSSPAFNGINGIIFNNGEMIAVNQSVSGPNGGNGSVLQLNSRTGEFKDFLIAPLNAPYSPQGIVFGGGNSDWRYPYRADHYYIANIIKSAETCDKVDEGDVFEYNDRGGLVGVLNHSNQPGLFSANFYPRGVVFGPDGMLYVSARGCPAVAPGDPRTLLAYILRFDPRTGRLNAVIATNETVEAQHLGFGFHRPEGLVFDNNGYLWVTSFFNATASANTKDDENVDRILKIDVRTRQVVDSIPLWKAGGDRASAQALIFGPEGKLYIPISGNTANTAGELRRCDTRNKVCEPFVPVGGGLVSPWFAIFQSSDPGTLRYERR